MKPLLFVMPGKRQFSSLINLGFEQQSDEHTGFLAKPGMAEAIRFSVIACYYVVESTKSGLLFDLFGLTRGHYNAGQWSQYATASQVK